MTSQNTHSNHLIDETSPYLLQHAHNPVDWRPWGDAAVGKARREDKPIFLSIGYSACHWCHVMAHESFEDVAVAELLNDHFVPIKVDREERPDLDKIYMNAVQMMTGQGGWPMNVWLTPELTPFYAGTYFPPTAQHGRPSFRSVLEQLRDAWQNDRDNLDAISQRVEHKLVDMQRDHSSHQQLDRKPLEHAYAELDRTVDSQHGGFGGAPKFPPGQQLGALLHIWGDREAEQAKRDRALDIVELTLARMASGGMYDQIGGGFHRYSVDEQWLIPHFEKMLYDNALLSEVYVEAWQATGRPFYRRVASQTLDYVLAEMTDAFSEDKRPFYSSQDADTSDGEGAFFVWTPQELADVLGGDDAQRAANYWGVSSAGNFEHNASVLNRLHHLDEHGHQAAFESVPDDVQTLRTRLLEARNDRQRPGVDTKILAAWNGMMIGAMAKAGFAFDEPRYLRGAARAADFVLDEMIDHTSEGRLNGDFGLMRTYKDGRARFPGYLDDFAWLTAGLLDLFEATGELGRLEQAQAVGDRMVELFWDTEGAGFYFTAAHHDDLLLRQKERYDGAVPAGNSVAIMDLLRLAEFCGRPEWVDKAADALGSVYDLMNKAPTGMCEAIGALDFHIQRPTQVVVARAAKTRSAPMRKVLRDTFMPNAVRVLVDSDRDDDRWADFVPLTRGRRSREGRPTAYVCFDGTCQQPATDADTLRDQLRGEHRVDR